MESYKKRLESKKQEVLEYTKLHGQGKALFHFDLKDNISFSKLMKEWTGDRDFGRVGEIGFDGYEGLLSQFVEVFTQKVTSLREDNRRLIWEIERLKAQRDEDKDNGARKLADSLKILKLA